MWKLGEKNVIKWILLRSELFKIKICPHQEQEDEAKPPFPTDIPWLFILFFGMGGGDGRSNFKSHSPCLDDWNAAHLFWRPLKHLLAISYRSTHTLEPLPIPGGPECICKKILLPLSARASRSIKMKPRSFHKIFSNFPKSAPKSAPKRRYFCSPPPLDKCNHGSDREKRRKKVLADSDDGGGEEEDEPAVRHSIGINCLGRSGRKRAEAVYKAKKKKDSETRDEILTSFLLWRKNADK